MNAEWNVREQEWLMLLGGIWLLGMFVLLVFPKIISSPKLLWYSILYGQLASLFLLIAACIVGLHLFGPPEAAGVAYAALVGTLIYIVVKHRRLQKLETQNPSTKENMED